MGRYLRFASAGTQFALTILLFVFGGRWLDERFPDRRPLFTLLGALLGITGATLSLVFQVMRQGERPGKRPGGGTIHRRIDGRDDS